LFGECAIYRKLERDVRVRNVDAVEAPFFDLFYQVEGMRSGMHNPDGVLWIRKPERRHTLHEGTVPLASVAPTILEMFDVAPPATMRSATLSAGADARAAAIEKEAVLA
jgi:predicted AlkP superfamily phosphohydrolase/phosphomutase